MRQLSPCSFVLFFRLLLLSRVSCFFHRSNKSCLKKALYSIEASLSSLLILSYFYSCLPLVSSKKVSIQSALLILSPLSPCYFNPNANTLLVSVLFCSVLCALDRHKKRRGRKKMQCELKKMFHLFSLVASASLAECKSVSVHLM